MKDIRLILFSPIRHITNQQEFRKRAEEIKSRLFDELLTRDDLASGWQRTDEGLLGGTEVFKTVVFKSGVVPPVPVNVFLSNSFSMDVNAHRACLRIGEGGPSRVARDDPRVLELAVKVFGLCS